MRKIIQVLVEGDAYYSLHLERAGAGYNYQVFSLAFGRRLVCDGWTAGDKTDARNEAHAHLREYLARVNGN